MQNSYNVLLVDDDKMIRIVGEKTLQKHFLSVTVAEGGKDALAKLTQKKYDLILLDVLMPDINGFELCKRIRSEPENLYLPIVMMTGLDDAESIQLSYDVGATDFITKPINWVLLSHRLLYILRASRTTSKLNDSLIIQEEMQENLKKLNDELEMRVLTRTAELENANKKLIHTLDELEKTQESLVATKKLAALGEVLSGVAHEIKNPLNFVINFNDSSDSILEEVQENINVELPINPSKPFLENLLVDIDIVRDNCKRIKAHSTKADDVVSMMLKHSQNTNIHYEECDIIYIIKNAIDHSLTVFKKKYGEFNFEFELNFSEDLKPINLIQEQIFTALSNIIDNGIYAIWSKKSNPIFSKDYKPKLSISAGMENVFLCITIFDNGIGVKKELLEKIFEPFYTTKPTGQGTGFGLSLAQEIIRVQHKGSLTLESEENQFCRVTIKLASNFIKG